MISIWKTSILDVLRPENDPLYFFQATVSLIWEITSGEIAVFRSALDKVEWWKQSLRCALLIEQMPDCTQWRKTLSSSTEEVKAWLPPTTQQQDGSTHHLESNNISQEPLAWKYVHLCMHGIIQRSTQLHALFYEYSPFQTDRQTFRPK